MATELTLTSYLHNPWDGTVAGSTDHIIFDYSNLDFVPSSSDSYKSTSGDIFKVYIDGVRIYRTADSAYAGGISLTGFLEDGDVAGSKLNGLTTIDGANVTWASTSDDVWTINTADQKVFVDQSAVLATALYGEDGKDISFTSGTTIIELRRSVNDESGPSVDFSNASILTEQDLDNSSKNVFHLAQQAVVTAEKGIIFDTGAGVWDAQQAAVDKKIRGVAAPVLDNEAVNRGFVTTNLPNINTVAGIAANVTTVATAPIPANMATIVGLGTNGSQVTTVAGKDTEIGRIGTAAMAASIALIGTAPMANSTDGDIKVVSENDANITKVANIDANVTKVADIDGNVTTVATLGTNGATVTTVAGKATEIGRLGTVDAVADMALLGLAPVITDMDLLGATGVIDDMALLGATGVIDDMGLLGATGVIDDMGLLGASGVIDDMALLTATGVIDDMALLGVPAVITDMDLLGASGVIADIATVTDSGNLAAINGAAGNATAAASSATAAKASAAAVASTFDSFDDTYLGTMPDTQSSATDADTTGTWAINSSVITVANATDIIVGQEVTGTGVPTDANVIAVNGVLITISENMVAAGTNVDLDFRGQGVYGVFNATKDGPSTDNDGGALANGMLYFNTTDNTMKVYKETGAAWIAATASGGVSLVMHKVVASGSETSFAAGTFTPTLSYEVNNIVVWLNGVKLDATDYTATTGTSITGLAALAASDELVVLAFKTFEVADAVSQASGGTFGGAVTCSAGLVANTADINAGTFDGIVGGTTPAAGSFTTTALTGTLTVGVNDAGHDVIFYGDTNGKKVTWDASADNLLLPDGVLIVLGNGNDLQLYANGGASYLHSPSSLYVSTQTSGAAVTIGHTTSEVTIGDNLTVNGDMETSTTGKIKQKGAFMQSSTHQAMVLGG